MIGTDSLRWRSQEDNAFEVVDALWLDDYRAWNWRIYLYSI
jgi:hypothetical protein